MAIGRISGPLLKANLLREGVNLAFENDLGSTFQQTKNEAVHMRPTNNFEEITEQEFDNRERAKA